MSSVLISKNFRRTTLSITATDYLYELKKKKTTTQNNKNLITSSIKNPDLSKFSNSTQTDTESRTLPIFKKPTVLKNSRLY